MRIQGGQTLIGESLRGADVSIDEANGCFVHTAETGRLN